MFKVKMVLLNNFVHILHIDNVQKATTDRSIVHSPKQFWFISYNQFVRYLQSISTIATLLHFWNRSKILAAN